MTNSLHSTAYREITAMLKTLTTTIALLLLVPSIVVSREWTDATGQHTVEAEFVKLNKSTVHLKTPGGREIKIALQGLSKADQQYVDSIVNAPKPTTPAPKPLPGVKPVSDQQIRKTLSRMQWSTRMQGNRPSGLLVLASPLTTENLRQLQIISQQVRDGALGGIEVASNDEKLLSLISTALRGKSVTCHTDLREGLTNKNTLAVFVGFMNAETARVLPQKEMRNDEALNQLVVWACQSGMDAYVFPGTRPWKVDPDAGTSEDNPVRASLMCTRVVWTSENPKGRTFADFLSTVWGQNRTVPGNRGLADLVSPFGSD